MAPPEIRRAWCDFFKHVRVNRPVRHPSSASSRRSPVPAAAPLLERARTPIFALLSRRCSLDRESRSGIPAGDGVRDNRASAARCNSSRQPRTILEIRIIGIFGEYAGDADPMMRGGDSRCDRRTESINENPIVDLIASANRIRSGIGSRAAPAGAGARGGSYPRLHEPARPDIEKRATDR